MLDIVVNFIENYVKEDVFSPIIGKQTGKKVKNAELYTKMSKERHNS